MMQPWIPVQTSYAASIIDICIDSNDPQYYVIFVKRMDDFKDNLLVRHSVFLGKFTAKYFGSRSMPESIGLKEIEMLIGQPVRAFYTIDFDGEEILTGIEKLLTSQYLS